MKLSSSEIQDLGKAAEKAASLAAIYIRSRKGQALDVESKEGGSSRASQVVTQVDRDCQEIILRVLAPSIEEYDLGLLTEESEDNQSRIEKDAFWCIDPLDGTLPFTEGRPGYAVSIALVSREGDSLLGVMHDPARNTWYLAQGGRGAWRNSDPFRSSGAGSELTVFADRSFETDPRYEGAIAFLQEAGKNLGYDSVAVVLEGGAVMNACWVLERAPAVYFKLPKKERGGGSLWDFAATSCLFNEHATAVVSDIEGWPLKLNRPETTFMNEEGVVFASDESIARLVYELAASLKKDL